MGEAGVCFAPWSRAFLSSSRYRQVRGGSKEQQCCGAGQERIGTHRVISSKAAVEDLTEGGCVFPGSPA